MAALRFLNLLTVSSLAILAASFGATPVSALSDGHHLAARHAHHLRGHDSMAKRKIERRSVRCRARDSSSASSASTASTFSTEIATTFTLPPSTTATPSAEQSTSTSGGGSSGGSGNPWGKTGVAWPNGDANAIAEAKPLNGATYYTWSPHKVSAAASAGFQFAAQLWGWNQVNDFQSMVQSGYANIALGMNEPNDAGQSNMSPESGAELWQKYIEPLKSQGYYLVSPACTSAPSGIQWIQDWLSACNGGCNPDAIAAHYYDTNADGFIDFVTNYHTTFNKDIWVTEFACQNFNGGPQASMDEIWAFMIKTVQWMDAQPWVGFYAWFGFMENMQNVNPLNRLLSEDGTTVTDLGKWYLGDHQ